MTVKHQVIVTLAASAREMYGIEIMQAVEGRRRTPMNPAVMYKMLASLERQGLVVSRVGASDHSHGGNRRRYYKLTTAGKAIGGEIRSKQPPAL